MPKNLDTIVIPMTTTIPNDIKINDIIDHLTGRFNLPTRTFKLQFNNVNYISKHNNKIAQILNDTYGTLHSGRLTAILGPSGAGKTSMLNVLSGFKTTGVTGQFRLNEQICNVHHIRKMSSYIPQSFDMLNLLTVEETFKVSTDLKLPKTTKEEEKDILISDTLQILKMEQCRQTFVCHLSGGERKRLSIGLELVTNPPIMFFDEPTSGLDSVASLQIIEHLRHLALQGRIIVCVIHQPSSRLMNLFDDILVMAQGEIIYCGPQMEMLRLFKEADFECPTYYNPADFVLEVGSQTNDTNISQMISTNKKRHIMLTTDKSSSDETNELKMHANCLISIGEAPIFTESTAFNADIEMVTSYSENVLNNDTINCDVFDEWMRIVETERQPVGLWQEFSTLTRRQYLSMSRNWICVQLRFISHIVIGLLLGIVFWQVGNDASKVLTNCSLFFFVEMFIFFGNAMPSILLCPQETVVLIREYLNGYYSMRSYFLAKIVAELPMQLLCPTFFIAILYYMTGQPNEFNRFAMCWGVCLLLAFLSHFIGLTIGCAVSLPMAMFLAPAISIPFMIFSGFFIRLHELLPIFRPLCDISFFRYSMEGLITSIYGYDRQDLNCQIEFCYFKSPRKLLKEELGMWDSDYWFDVSVLLIWNILLKISFYFILKYRIRKAQ